MLPPLGVYRLGGAAAGCDVEVVVVTSDRERAAYDGVATHAPAEDLRSPMTVGRRWLAIDTDGLATLDARDNNALTRWVLRERSTVLSGPPAHDLVAEVSSEALRAEALGSARARAEELEDDPDPRSWTREVQLGCRTLWAAAHASVVDDAVAITFARGTLDPSHHHLLDDVAAGRDPAGCRAATRAFVWDVVRLSGTWALEAREPD